MISLSELKLPQEALESLRVISSEALSLLDRKVYLVGGTVRDELYNRLTSSTWRRAKRPDLDLVIERTSELPPEIIYRLERIPGYRKRVLLSEKDQVIRIVADWGYLDITVTPLPADEELMRRDITINALGVDLSTGDFLNPAGGLEDLRRGIIRAISRNNLINDPIRMLRVARFSIAMKMNLDLETAEMVSELSILIKEESPSRLMDEILKLFREVIHLEELMLLRELGLDEHLFGFRLVEEPLKRCKWLLQLKPKEKLTLMIAVMRDWGTELEGLLREVIGERALHTAGRLSSILRALEEEKMNLTVLKSLRGFVRDRNILLLSSVEPLRTPRMRELLMRLRTKRLKVRGKEEFERALDLLYKEVCSIEEFICPPSP